MANAQDRTAFDELIRHFDREKPSQEYPEQLILEMGKFFLGTPYVAGSLETKAAEHLIVNLREFDCVTFAENVVALVRLVRSRQKSFEAFRKLLQKIRYRQGRLQGYSSRLHYFSDWIHDNQKKGILRDVTAEIGGRPFKKTLTFMTTHADLYPPLKEAINLRRMKSLERRISKRSLFFIPKRALRHSEHKVRNGDLVAITTTREGLDVQHVGFAVRVRDRIHLLHASGVEGKVILSKDTLYRYLMQSKTRSGIMVARLL
jgi:N-acetylmuramoyl-L-alanine amidase-like